MSNFGKRVAVLSKNPDVIFDAKPILRALNELEPGLKKQMLREMKGITKPAITEIKKVIPDTAPMSGMSLNRTTRAGGGSNSNPTGRLSWDGGKYKNAVIKPDNVIPKFSSGRSRRSSVTSLFGIWLRSPGVSMVATAGRGSGVSKYATTREYDYKGGRRSHRNNGQGQALIARVKSSGLYNFFYKAGEKKIPSMETEVKLTWEKYSKLVSRRLG
jgi:hypothetical protein